MIDIDFNWRNPITNVRTFGSDPDTVLSMASAYMDGIGESPRPMAVCIKHFPGDGVDERDHHLLTTMNSLSADKWMESFGRVYKTLIDKGAQTLMCGHIIQPALERLVQPDIAEKDMLPASHSKNLIQGIIRNKLGFKGLITTDATPMVGFSALKSRAEALRMTIAAGADMIVFCKNIEEDYASIREGIASGEISLERLDEAVCRQLALKASLGLHRNALPPEEAMEILGCSEHTDWARECADKAITLVKDNASLLPLSPEKTKRVRLTVLGENSQGGFGECDSIAQPFKTALENAGFEVSFYDYASMERGDIFTCGVED
ncbi:MAG: glycoside hydrolase family 3 protein, partial [Oscillospiraceae bacterium]|nr:glycoside hydrolase family 3 protein [Oscillospiraceae bacterium]